MHGYQLLSALAELFGSQYRPSPGSVYPALAALKAEGLVLGEESVSRTTTFHVTATGTEALAARADALAVLEQRTSVRISHAESLEAAIARFKARLGPIAPGLDFSIVLAALDRAATEIESRHRLATKEEDK